MVQTDNATPDGEDGHETPSPVEVCVERSGGVAGIRRHWRAQPRPDEAAHWTDLIEECPWDSAVPETTGADRFTWRIRARCGAGAQRCIDLPDTGVEGPWRVLIDAVRSWQPRSAG